MGCNPCCCWSIRDGAVTIGIWSVVYAFASLILFGWQFAVLNNCRSVTMAQANLQCEYYCPCVGASTARTSSLIEDSLLLQVFGIVQLIIFGWQSYAIKWERDRAAGYQVAAPQTFHEFRTSAYFENFYDTSTTKFYTACLLLQIFCIIQFVIFGWQMAAIKYKKDRAADTILPNYYEYGHFDVPSYYESYWQSPEERFYTALFIIQILCLVVAFFLLFTSVGLIYGAHTFSRYLIYPWFPCMIASILCSLTYCIIWWTGDVRDYWLVLTILEMIGVFINLYCLVVVIIFTRQMNSMREYYKESNRIERFDSLNDRYNDYREDNYNQFNRLSSLELDYPVKPNKGLSSLPLRDEYNRLPDRAPEYYNQAPMPYQHFHSPPRPARFDESSRPLHHNRLDFENDDDMVSKWVKEQQLIGSEGHANSEPASPTKEPFPILQHSLSVPSMYAETSGGITCPYHCHKSHRHHHRSSRHRSRDYDRTSSHRHGRRHRHRSSSIGSRSRRSYSSSSGSSIYTDEPRRHRHRSRSRHLYSDDGTDATDDSRTAYKRHQRSSRKDRDYERDRRGPRHVKRADRERGSRSSMNIALTQDTTGGIIGSPVDHLEQEWQGGVPQGSITIPQHIIIPPSAGTLGPDSRPQPQTYQINSEIRISYDQQGRPIVPEAPVITQRPTVQPQLQRAPSANSPSVINGKTRKQPISITSIV